MRRHDDAALAGGGGWSGWLWKDALVAVGLVAPPLLLVLLNIYYNIDYLRERRTKLNYIYFII